MIEFFYSPGSATVKAFFEAVPSDLLPQIDQTPTYRDTMPAKAHMVLVAGTGKASSAVERLAWRLGAFPVYVPESSEWLERQIRLRMADGPPLVMVDASLAGTNKLSGAH